MRRAALALVLSGCHSVIAIDPPPRAGGKTLIVIRALNEAPQTVEIIDATSTVELPGFSRQGDVEVVVVELKCGLEVLGLEPGPVDLIAPEMAYEEERLPTPLSIMKLTISGDEASGWITPEPAGRNGWLSKTLRRIEARGDIPCRSRGFVFNEVRVDAHQASSIVAIGDGTALVLHPQGFERLDATGMLTELGNTLPRAVTATSVAVGVLDPDGKLWVLDDHGELAHAPTVSGEMTYVAKSPLRHPQNLVRDAKGGLYAAPLYYGGRDFLGVTIPADVAYYDRTSDRWSALRLGVFEDGVGFIDMLGLDGSVIVAGADYQLFSRSGQGRLLELDTSVTSSITRRWTTLPPPGPGRRMSALAIADTRMLGRVVAGSVCQENIERDGCSRNPRDDVHGIVAHESEGTWTFPGIETEFSITTVADAGPNAIWVGGLGRLGRDSGRLDAHFEDGLVCNLFENGVAKPQIIPLADGAWAVSAPFETLQHNDVTYVYRPTQAPDDCTN